MSILNLEESFKKAKLDNISKFYVLINIENSIFKEVGNDNYYAYPIDPYNKSIETIKKLQDRSDIKIIFNSNIDNTILSKIFHFLKNNGITNYYFNKNDDVTNIGNKYYDNGNYYFNYLIDRRAGFDPTKDWEDLANVIDELRLEPSDYAIKMELMSSLDEKIDDMYEYFDTKDDVVRNITDIQFKLQDIRLEYKWYLTQHPKNKQKVWEVIEFLGIANLLEDKS